MKRREVLEWVYDILGGSSALLIGLGTSSWLVGFGVLLAFGAIRVTIELVVIHHVEL